MQRWMKVVGLSAVAALTGFGCASGPVSRSDARISAPEVRTTDAKGEAAGPQMPQISQRAKLYFEDATKAYNAQAKSRQWDYPGLKRKFEAALREDGNLAEAAYNLGVISEREGNTTAALEHYKDALRRKPTLKEAAENMAVIAQNKGDTGTAVSIYKDILRYYPDDASSRARLAEIYRAGGEHDRALDLARQALVRDPKTLAAYKVMMRSYLDRKQLSLAKLVALRALKLDENDPELYHTVGLILLEEKEREKARVQFKKAIGVRADYYPSHLVLAKLALESDDYGGAEEHLRRVLQVDGKNAEAHLNLGVAYKGMGQFDKAMQQYDQAEKLNPNLPGIYLNRGIILHRQKDAPERGLELYRKYIAMAGEVAGDGKVMELIKEAEQIIGAKEEAKRAEAEAKRMEAEAKAMEQQKAEEDKLKAQEAKEAKGSKEPGAPQQPAPKQAKTADAKPAPADPKPAAETKSAKATPKKPEAPKPVPAKAEAGGDGEPADEPLDNF